MPRIPSAGEVSSIGAGAARLPSIRAEAADFGLDAAGGLKNLAGGVAAAAPLLDDLVAAWSKTETAKQTTEPVQHATAIRDAAFQMVDTWEFDGSSPQEAAARSSRELEALEERRLKDVAPEQRQHLKAASAPIRQGHALRVAQRAQNLSVAALNRQTGETLELLQSQAEREPGAAAHYVAEGRGQLRALLAAGALTPEQFADQEQAFRRGLLAKVVRGQPAVQAMADLEDGVYDALFDDAGLKRALMEETAWRLHSETAVGAAAAAAQLVRVRRGEASPGGLSASTRAILAAGEMADAELQAEIALRVRAEVERLRFAPEAELSRRLEELAPLADAPDAETRERIRQEAWTQGQAMLSARRADPAAYVMQQPAVAEAFAAAARDPALLPDAVTARLAAQSAMGLMPEEQNALAAEERDAVVGGLRRLEPDQQIAVLSDLCRRYGDQAPAVAADLAETGLSLELQLAMDPSGNPAVAGTFAQAAQTPSKARMQEGLAVEEAANRLIASAEGAERQAVTGSADTADDENPALPRREPEGTPVKGEAATQSTAPLNRTLRLQGDPRDQILTILRIGRGDVYDEHVQFIAEDKLDGALALAQETLSILDTLRREGNSGLDAHRRKIGAILQAEAGSPHARFVGNMLKEMTDRIVANPLRYPVLLTDDELRYGLNALTGQSEEGMSTGTKIAVAGAAVDGLSWLTRKGSGVGWAIDIAGIIAGFSSDKRQELLNGIASEMRRRGLLQEPDLEDSLLKQNLSPR